MKQRSPVGLWICCGCLPTEVQRTADKAFALLKRDPRHPSLRFKKLGDIWSARVGLHHRALAVEAPDDSVVLDRHGR